MTNLPPWRGFLSTFTIAKQFLRGVKASLAFHRNGSQRYYLKVLSLKKIFFWTENYMLCWNGMVVGSDYIFFSHFGFTLKCRKHQIALHLFPFLPDTVSLVCRIKSSFNIKLPSFIPIPRLQNLRTMWLCIILYHRCAPENCMQNESGSLNVTLTTNMGKRCPGSNPAVVTLPSLWNEWAGDSLAYLQKF